MPRLVSICIPTYNQAQYLPAAVESALNQTYENLEVVVSENHSTDGSRAYLESVGHPKLRVVRPERHLTAAENGRFVIAASSGEYVNVLCSDDLLFPDYAAKLAAVLDRHPAAAWAYSGAELINQNGHRIGVERHNRGSFFRPGNKELPRFLKVAGCVFSTILMRRRCYERAGGFVPGHDMVSDWDLQLRLLSVGGVAYEDEILAQCRIWSDPERKERVRAHIEDVAHLYDTAIAAIVRSHPELAASAAAGRRAWARSFAQSWPAADSPKEFEDGALRIRGLADCLEVRLLIWLQRRGFYPLIRRKAAAEQFVRFATKRVLFLFKSASAVLRPAERHT